MKKTKIEGTESTTEVTENVQDEIKSIVLPAPTFEYFASEKVVDIGNDPLTLNMVSSSQNQVTDVKKWFTDNGLNLGQGQKEDGLGKIIEYSDGIYTYKILKAKEFRDEWFSINPYKILEIYSTETEELLYSLDFTNYIFLPEYSGEDDILIKQNLVWVKIKDNILYVSNSHYSYASDTNNFNAYITAIDLSDMSILWRTDPLVANSYTFEIVNNVLICGYGYTDEADYIYQIDLNNGEIIDEISLETAPEYFIVKDSIIHIRCFDMDYQFEIQ